MLTFGLPNSVYPGKETRHLAGEELNLSNLEMRIMQPVAPLILLLKLR